jgi:hypothetical protein
MLQYEVLLSRTEMCYCLHFQWAKYAY